MHTNLRRLTENTLFSHQLTPLHLSSIVHASKAAPIGWVPVVSALSVTSVDGGAAGKEAEAKLEHERQR